MTFKKWLNDLRTNYFGSWSKFEFFWIPFSCILLVVTCILTWDITPYPVLNLVATISGMICVALVSGKKISNWIWGIINTVAFAIYYIIAYENNSGLEYALLNLVYYLPLQFVGIWYWIKKSDETKIDTVKPRTFGIKGWVLTILAFIVILPILTIIQSVVFEGATLSTMTFTAFLMATGTTTGLIAQIFMNLAMPQMWPFWVLEDIAMTWFNLMAGNIPMALMFAVWGANATWGMINWFSKIQKSN
jgi:nicotinamide mononucleotide transporter